MWLTLSGRHDDFGTPITRNNDYAVPNSPNCNWLVMDTRTSKLGIREHLANRKKLVKGKPDPFIDALHDPESFDIPANVSVVDITAVNPLESFHGGSFVCFFLEWNGNIFICY
jgi:hypothetical protein